MDTVVLIPAYNEEKNIEETIKRVKKSGFTPLIVDDFSKDRTVEISKKNKALVLKHERNKGKGEALITGFKHISKKLPKVKYIILLDADLQYMPEEIPKLIKPLKENKADYVTGFRNWKRDVPFRNRVGNFVWRSFFNVLFKTRLKDSNCGFIAMKRDVMEKLKVASFGGYIIDNVMMVVALTNDFRIKQVQVKVFYNKMWTVPHGSRFVLGNLIYIIESGIKYRFGINLKLYERMSRTGLIFTKKG